VFIVNGDRSWLGPLANDNPRAEFGWEDYSIMQKGQKWANRLMKDDRTLKCFCEHYRIRRGHVAE
jgi:hypothetical protein